MGVVSPSLGKCQCGGMLVGHDVVVSFVQSDFDAVGAYGGGVSGGR